MTNGETSENWIGFDLGGTKMLAKLFDAKFQTISKERKKTRGFDGQEAVIQKIIRTIRGALTQADTTAVLVVSDPVGPKVAVVHRAGWTFLRIALVVVDGHNAAVAPHGQTASALADGKFPGTGCPVLVPEVLGQVLTRRCVVVRRRIGSIGVGAVVAGFLGPTAALGWRLDQDRSVQVAVAATLEAPADKTDAVVGGAAGHAFMRSAETGTTGGTRVAGNVLASVSRRRQRLVAAPCAGLVAGIPERVHVGVAGHGRLDRAGGRRRRWGRTARAAGADELTTSAGLERNVKAERQVERMSRPVEVRVLDRVMVVPVAIEPDRVPVGPPPIAYPGLARGV